MRTWITNRIKGAVLRFIESRGYALVKQPPQTSSGAMAKPAAVPARLQVRDPVQAAEPVPPQFGPDLDPRPDADLRTFLTQVAAAIGGDLPGHATAVFAAMRYLTKTSIPGDVVDCGEGTSANIALAATALMILGDTSRRLVIFDVTADATHRPDAELTLWGSDWSDLIDERVASHARKIDVPPTPLPKALVATGYPPDAFSVVRIPFEMIDLSRPIAFLSVTTETYEANRAAIRTLMPRVSMGGVIAVDGSAALRPSQPGCVQHGIDAVAQYLMGSGTKLSFWQPVADFRLAVKASS